MFGVPYVYTQSRILKVSRDPGGPVGTGGHPGGTPWHSWAPQGHPRHLGDMMRCPRAIVGYPQGTDRYPRGNVDTLRDTVGHPQAQLSTLGPHGNPQLQYDTPGLVWSSLGTSGAPHSQDGTPVGSPACLCSPPNPGPVGIPPGPVPDPGERLPHLRRHAPCRPVRRPGPAWQNRLRPHGLR